jgi:choline dehydrogenase-like flavoprotein
MAELARAAGATRIVALSTPDTVWEGSGSDDASFNEFRGRLARYDLSPNRATVFSAHQMGSARAGADPRESACDPWGRVRADDRGRTVPGLYVADASLFPTALGVNPMVTVMLMGDRVARAVHEDR